MAAAAENETAALIDMYLRDMSDTHNDCCCTAAAVVEGLLQFELLQFDPHKQQRRKVNIKHLVASPTEN